jgi:hypothetical protein
MTKPELKPEFKEIGLGKQDITQAFLAKARGLQSQWEHLTPDQRLAKIKTIVNDTFSSAGFPKVEVEKEGWSEIFETHAKFSQSTYSIKINEKWIEEDKIQDSHITELAKVIYHEMRHGEQCYRGIQVLAKNLNVSSKEAEKIQELANQHEIENIEFVTQAIQAGEVNKLSGTEAEFAEVMCEVFFGDYAKNFEAIKLDYLEHKIDVAEARDEYFKVLWDPNTPREQKEAIKLDLDRLLDRYEEKREEYREAYKNSPAEKDAKDLEDVLIPSSIPAQTAQVAESSSVQTGESSRQQVQDNEITQAQPGAVPGARPEAIEMEDLGAPRPVGAPPPRPRPRRSTNPISDCLPCFGRSRSSDSRSSGRPRSRDDRRTR